MNRFEFVLLITNIADLEILLYDRHYNVKEFV